MVAIYLVENHDSRSWSRIRGRCTAKYVVKGCRRPKMPLSSPSSFTQQGGLLISWWTLASCIRDIHLMKGFWGSVSSSESERFTTCKRIFCMTREKSQFLMLGTNSFGYDFLLKVSSEDSSQFTHLFIIIECLIPERRWHGCCGRRSWCWGRGIQQQL